MGPRIMYHFTKLKDLLKSAGRTKKCGGACHTQKRADFVTSQLKLLENPPSPLVDTPHQISWWEQTLLGVPISCSKVDGCDIEAANCTCKEFVGGRGGYIVLGVEVTHVHEIKTKTGQNPGAKMARVNFNDGTCEVEGVAFPEVWAEYGCYLTVGNPVVVQGERSKKDGGFIVKKVWQAAIATTN